METSDYNNTASTAERLGVTARRVTEVARRHGIGLVVSSARTGGVVGRLFSPADIERLGEHVYRRVGRPKKRIADRAEPA